MPFMDDLAFILEEDNVATPGSTLFVGPLASVTRQLPSGEPVLVLYPTSGSEPTAVHNITATPAYTNPSAQIAAHGVDFEETMNLAQAAYNSLYSVRNEYIGSGEVLPWYLWIRPLQEPYPLGVDPQGVIRIVFNVTARRRA